MVRYASECRTSQFVDRPRELVFHRLHPTGTLHRSSQSWTHSSQRPFSEGKQQQVGDCVCRSNHAQVRGNQVKPTAKRDGNITCVCSIGSRACQARKPTAEGKGVGRVSGRPFGRYVHEKRPEDRFAIDWYGVFHAPSQTEHAVEP